MTWQGKSIPRGNALAALLAGLALIANLGSPASAQTGAAQVQQAKARDAEAKAREAAAPRAKDAQAKADTMRTYWIPAVNNVGGYGRWAVAEFTDVYAMESNFETTIDARLAELIDAAAAEPAGQRS